jgi:hypothetical protein
MDDLSLYIIIFFVLLFLVFIVVYRKVKFRIDAPGASVQVDGDRNLEPKAIDTSRPNTSTRIHIGGDSVGSVNISATGDVDISPTKEPRTKPP